MDGSAETVKRPLGVHTITDVFSPPDHLVAVDGQWVRPISEPYHGNRLVAAWWVLTGRAYALIWPEAGDLEAVLGQQQLGPNPMAQKRGYD